MLEALKEAKIAFSKNEIPIGVIIVNSISNKIIIRSHNQIEKEKNSILHAEIIAINLACRKLKTKYLNTCDIYVTLEPCDMCINAINISRIKRLFYAVSNNKQKSYYTEIYEGIGFNQSQKLIQKFFYKLRNK